MLSLTKTKKTLLWTATKEIGDRMKLRRVVSVKV